MKKIILSAFLLAMIVGACNEEELPSSEEATEITNIEAVIQVANEPQLNSVSTTNTTLTAN